MIFATELKIVGNKLTEHGEKMLKGNRQVDLAVSEEFFIRVGKKVYRLNLQEIHAELMS